MPSAREPNQPRTHGSVTDLLICLRADEIDLQSVTEKIYAALYRELHQAAEIRLRREYGNHTLQPTDLVHEAFLKLTDPRRVNWRDRSHFLAVATRAMRQVLVDHARRRGANKRGAGWRRVSFDGVADNRAKAEMAVLDLDQSLGRLRRLSQRTAEVAAFRIIGGMSHPEIAAVQSVSVRTVAADWAVARRWLARELADYVS